MILYGLGALIAFVLAWAAAGRRPAFAVALYTGFAVVALVGFAETLGQPRPSILEWRDLAGATVLAYKLDEPNAVYLWIEGDPPTSYRMPWLSGAAAKSLHDAARLADEQGTRLVIADEAPEDESMMFHPGPVPPLPPKHFR